MPGSAYQIGTQLELEASAAHAAGTFSSLDFWLVDSGGMIFTVDITNQNSGSLTTFNVQAKRDTNYDTVATFTGLAQTATGRLRFRMGPGAARAAGANAYTGAAEDWPPPMGRVQVINAAGTVTYSIFGECLGL